VSDELVKLTRTLQVVARDLDSQATENRERGYDCAAKAFTDEAEAVREAAALIAAQAAEIEEFRFTVRRLTQAISRAVDDLETVGNDYPGSSCQQWCSERAAAAWAQIAGAEAALAPANKETNDGR
jgi:hypothetical protein